MAFEALDEAKSKVKRRQEKKKAASCCCCCCRRRAEHSRSVPARLQAEAIRNELIEFIYPDI